MNKKTCAAVLTGVTLLTTSLLGGCASDDKTPGTGPKQTSFTYWVPMHSSIATLVNSYNDVEMYKKLEQDTGIHMEFIHPALGLEAEQFNLLVASRDLPDLIEYSWNDYQGGPQKAIDDGVIRPLNDYMEYAPNFHAVLTGTAVLPFLSDELTAIYDKGSKTDNGNYFAFPAFNIENYRIFGGPVIRKDWLDELALSVPETIDDWEKVLRAFKNQKGATAPVTGNKEMFNGNTPSFHGAFGIGAGLYIDGSTVKYGPMEDGYKEYLTLLNRWYQEGLLDKDFSTNTSTLIDSKFTKGDSGALFGYLGASVGRYLTQMKSEDPSYDLICAPYPVKNAGETNSFCFFEGDVVSRFLAITTSCKDPATAASWADFFYTQDGYNLVNFGVEGKSYNMVDGKPVYTDAIMNDPTGLSVSEMLGLNCRATGPAPGFKQAPAYLEQYYEYPQQVEGFQLWSENTDSCRAVSLPASITPLTEESEKLSSIQTDLKTYVEEMTLKFIDGSEPLDNFDSFRETMKNSFNVEEYLKIQQGMYDRYLKR